MGARTTLSIQLLLTILPVVWPLMSAHGLRNSLMLRVDGSEIILDVLGLVDHHQPCDGLPAQHDASIPSTTSFGRNIRSWSDSDSDMSMGTLRLHLPPTVTSTVPGAHDGSSGITFFQRLSTFVNPAVEACTIPASAPTTPPSFNTLLGKGLPSNPPTPDGKGSPRKVRFSSLMKVIPKPVDRVCSDSSSEADVSQVQKV
jgi:hypothetical protein